MRKEVILNVIRLEKAERKAKAEEVNLIAFALSLKRTTKMIDEPLIVADFSAVPDRIPPIPAGIYDFTVDTVEKKAPKVKTDGTPPSLGFNIVVNAHISGPATSPHVNRKMTQYLWVSQDPSLSKEDRDFNLMAIKRFDKACGGTPETTGSVNVNLWIGKVFKAAVKGDVYQGRETSKIDRVFIPGDAELK